VGYNPSYKWIKSTYPICNWGYNPLTIRGMSHQVSQKLPTFEEFYSKQSTNWWNDAGRLLQDTLAGQNSGVVERHAGSCWRSWGRMDRITMANYGWLVVWNISYGVMMVNDG